MWCTVNVVDLLTILDKSSYFSNNFTSSSLFIGTLNSKEFRLNSLKIALSNFCSHPMKSKMVGSNGTMIAIRLVRSKLRKREEHSNSIHPADVVQTAGPAAPSSTPSVPQALQADTLTYQGQFLWPPPVQPYLYNNDQVNLVHNLPTERPGFANGFRKNLGGRWRRLVKRKPSTEIYTIPAELKPQLKQIYVY